MAKKKILVRESLLAAVRSALAASAAGPSELLRGEAFGTHA
jgi:hypothetical protein